MKNKNPYVLKKPLIIYNTLQILLNVYMISGLIGVPKLNNIFGLNTPFDDNLRYFTYVHYLSKYFDYCDTWFIILHLWTFKMPI
jgi:hypothetical protein